MPEQIPLYVLSGGRSSRFGSDKARARYCGETLLQRQIRLLEPIAFPVTVVADRAGKYDDLMLRTIADIAPGSGPLGGLESALQDRGQGWLLLTCCDMVAVNPEWVAQLCDQRKPGATAVVFKGQFFEALFTLYHSSMLPAVQERRAKGDLSLQDLFDSPTTIHLPLPNGWPALAHVNTPLELARSEASVIAEVSKQEGSER